MRESERELSTSPTGASHPASGYQVLTFDAQTYCEYLSGFDLSEAEQAQVLEALWAIMVAFVDLGFRIHPVQQAAGEPGDTMTETVVPRSGPMLPLMENLTTPTIKTAEAGISVKRRRERNHDVKAE